MTASSRTTEGLPNRCPVCGKQIWAAPCVPPGDGTCPHCGSIVWFDDGPGEVPDDVAHLEQLGATVETDDEGQVTSVRLSGSRYTDAVVEQLAKLKDVQTMDVRNTRITAAGLARLRRLLPNTRINP